MENKVDSVFISYRRSTSKYPALLVYKDLNLHGYDTFIDYESIDSGKFAPEILNQIASRRHFIVILSPGCLDRTVNPDDWLKKEIEYAMDMQRNIVPLLFDKFEFKDNKQYFINKLSTLSDYNAQPVPDGFFDEAMVKVRDRFLKQPAKGVIKPAPKTDNTFVQNALQRANHAAVQDNVQDAVRKYLGNRPLLREPTMVDKVLARPAQQTKTPSPVPATASLIGRQPLQGEIIYLLEPAYKTFWFEGHDGRIIITDKRLIFVDLKDSQHSFEIPMAKLASAELKYHKFWDILERLTISTRNGEKYFVDMDEKLKIRVEKMIKQLSSTSSNRFRR